MPSTSSLGPVIRTKGIGVSFGGVSVLRDITLDIMPGEVHGLVGENGAGKSTLGKVLGGYYSASQGEMEVFGSPAISWNPSVALERGVAIMHQELQLVPALSVAQNVFLGIEEKRFGILKNTEATRLKQLMRSSGFSLDPHALVESLSIADQQKIEILRALARDARVIVMDEPTSSLSKNEVVQLHKTMTALTSSGCSVIYVSHFLDDILSVCDRITILRDGNHVRTAARADECKESIVSAMLGDDKTETFFPKKRIPHQPDKVLEVRNLTTDTGIRNVSLTVGKGEIVGLIGLVGSGRSEIARAIIGADPATSGEVLLDGKPYQNRTPAKSTKRGMVLIPEDRRKQGLVMTLPVRANMTLPHLAEFSTMGVLRTPKEVKKTREFIEDFSIRPAKIDGDVSIFSGGNQQKVLIAKWLLEAPDIVILDEPSRGVDIGARERIHEAIATIAARGSAVLIISSEIDEVLGLSHRAHLVDRGQIVEEINPDEVDDAVVLDALFQHQNSRRTKKAS